MDRIVIPALPLLMVIASLFMTVTVIASCVIVTSFASWIKSRSCK
jgi:hypothetical protein